MIVICSVNIKALNIWAEKELGTLPREKQPMKFIDGLPKVWLAKTTQHTSKTELLQLPLINFANLKHKT